MTIRKIAEPIVGPIFPLQRTHELALRMAFDLLRRRKPSDDKLRALGAVRQDGMICIPALYERLLIDPTGQNVFVVGKDDGERRGRAGHAWALVAMHYLCAADVSVDLRAVSFSDFTDSLGYVSVFTKRVIGRFLATSGRKGEQFEAASRHIGGQRFMTPEIAFAFDVLPRVPIIFVRHEGDEDLSAGANVIYHADAAHLLPAEDRIVAAELVIDALNGKQLAENGGIHAQRR